MKKTTLKMVLPGLLIALGTASCNKDEDLVDVPPPVGNEQEVITTLQLHFVESGMPSNTFTYEYSDVDGIGGNPPVADTIKLDVNKTYQVTIDVLNESESPADTLTGEIFDERDEHLFCFEVMSGDLTINRTDTDNNSLEVGLMSNWITGLTSGSGHMHVTLKH